VTAIVEAIVSKLSFKGVVVGGVTDIVATTILSIPVVAYIMMTKLQLSNLSQDQLQIAVTAALQADRLLYVCQLIVGSACSVLGGYIGARLAKHDELLNGSLTSFLCVGGGFYALATGVGSGSLLLHVAGFVVSPALGLLGGYLRLVEKRASGTTVQPTQSTASDF
jgi:hypothetical protein